MTHPKIRSNIWLYAHPSMEPLARTLAESCKGLTDFGLSEETMAHRKVKDNYSLMLGWIGACAGLK